MTGDAVPDIITLQGQAEPRVQANGQAIVQSGGAVHDDSNEGAVALAPCPTLVQELGPAPYDHLARRIVIRGEWEGDAVVAVLELVSRGNKSSQVKAEQLVKKVVGFLEQGIHLVLVDIHDPTAAVPTGFHPMVCVQYGERPLPVPLDRGLSAVSYQVLETGRIRSHMVPLKAGDGLPEMPIFLLQHKFVRLPLEQTYDDAYRSLPRKYREVLKEPSTPRS